MFKIRQKYNKKFSQTQHDTTAMIESRTVGASVIFAILNKELQLIMDTSNGLDAILHKILIALKIFKIRQKNKKFDFFM